MFEKEIDSGTFCLWRYQMSNKLNFEKDRQKTKPKEQDTDGLRPLNEIGQNNTFYSPKISASEAKKILQENIEKLSKQLTEIKSLSSKGLISNSQKITLVKKFKDSIHNLRSSTYVSGRIDDNHHLMIKARAVVDHLSESLPLKPAAPGLALSTPRGPRLLRKRRYK